MAKRPGIQSSFRNVPKMIMQPAGFLRKDTFHIFSSVVLYVKERVYGGHDGVWRTLCFMVPCLAF